MSRAKISHRDDSDLDARTIRKAILTKGGDATKKSRESYASRLSRKGGDKEEDPRAIRARKEKKDARKSIGPQKTPRYASVATSSASRHRFISADDMQSLAKQRLREIEKEEMAAMHAAEKARRKREQLMRMDIASSRSHPRSNASARARARSHSRSRPAAAGSYDDEDVDVEEYDDGDEDAEEDEDADEDADEDEDEDADEEAYEEEARVSAPEPEKRAKHRYRPGTVAKREAIKQQKSIKPLIRKLPFCEITRRITARMDPDARFEGEAMATLQSYVESQLVNWVRCANLVASESKLMTLSPGHLNAALAVLREGRL